MRSEKLKPRDITPLEDYRGIVAEILCKVADEYHERGDEAGRKAISDALTRVLLTSFRIFPDGKVHYETCKQANLVADGKRYGAYHGGERNPGTGGNEQYLQN